jgi:exodeoxyribonuclease X
MNSQPQVDSVTTIVVFDTETTDMDPDQGAEICEIGIVSLNKVFEGEWAIGPGLTSLIETTAPFSPAARAAHHLSPEMCQPGAPNCISRASLIKTMTEMEKPGQMLYAAHNATFDLKFLPELKLGTIDTYQMARHLWPEAPKYSNQVLRYYLGAEPPPDLLAGLAPHRALYDAACTAAILAFALNLYQPGELLRLSQTPVLLTKVNFGKHKDKPWSEIPLDYLQWMVRGSDMYTNDPEIKFVVDHWLNIKTNRLPI